MGEIGTLASLGAAFGAGILSVLSPCVMPLMPAYLSLVSGVSVEEMREGSVDAGLRRRVLAACVGFVLGFSTVFVVLGAGATALGRVLRGWHLEVAGLEIGMPQIAGVVIIVMGLHLTGLVPIKFLNADTRIQTTMRPRTMLGTYLVGAAFAFGWSPCVGPILGGILTMAGSRDTLSQGVLLLSVYSAGLAVPFLLAGWSIEFFFRFFHRIRQHFRRLEIASGALLVAVGLLVLTNQMTRLNSYFGFLNAVVTSLEEALL